jgi:hypothetical protein
MSERPIAGGPASQVAFESCTVESREGKTKVTLRLRNQGETAVFVVSRPRRVTVDDGGATLTLWMTDRGTPAPEHPIRHLTMPRVTAMKAGEERTIEAELPEKMTRLREVREGGELTFDVLDIAATQRVVVKLAVAETPFYFNPKRQDLLGQLQEWGEDAEVTVERVERAKQTKR